MSKNEPHNAKFDFLKANLDDVIFTLDDQGRYLELIGNWAKDIDHDIFLGKNAVEIMGEKEGVIHLDAVEKVKQKGSFRYVWSKTMNGDDQLYFDTRLTVIYNNGEIEKILGIGRDITEYVSIQKSILQLQKRHEFVLDAMNAGVWEWDLTSNSIKVNDRRLKMLGYTRAEMDEITLEEWLNMIHPDDLAEVSEIHHQNILDGPGLFRTRYRMKHKDGHWIWIMDMGGVFERDDQGDPKKVMGANLDISDQVALSTELNRLQEHYEAVFERSSYPKLIEKEGIIHYCNDAAAHSLGYDKKEDLIGKSVVEFSPETQPGGQSSESYAQELIQRARMENSVKFEWIHLSRSGQPKRFVVTLVHMQEEDYRFVEWRDITEQKQNEEMLIEAYQERGVLLSEIHHRVKNNLATVTGLLQLQKIHSGNDFVSESLDKSIQRVNTIAQMHKELYSNEQFSVISLNEHIQNQVDTLKTIYSDQNPALTIDLNMQNVNIGMEQALPVGLLVNEVLTNTFKYAFRARDNGCIHIYLSEDEQGEVYLEIGDDGVGLPEQTDPSHWSLGTTLIKSFVEQLDGEMVKETNNGLIYKLRFTKN